jgi:hypothetical protein
VLVNRNIFSLIIREFSKFSSKRSQVKLGDLFVQLLWKYVNVTIFILVSVSVLPEIDLSKYLVGE